MAALQQHLVHEFEFETAQGLQAPDFGLRVCPTSSNNIKYTSAQAALRTHMNKHSPSNCCPEFESIMVKIPIEPCDHVISFAFLVIVDRISVLHVEMNHYSN